MEIGSGGGGGSAVAGGGDGGGGGDDQLRHGLQFGKKIYFEDSSSGGSSSGGGGANAASSSSKPAASGGGKKGKGSAAPPRCQVEGCEVDLTASKGYYCRHKVCSMHAKSPRVVVAGLEQRFCQQCSRFHQLPEFDQGKRSCRRRLAGHNERRRRPPAGPLASRYGRLAASFESGRFRSYLLDFSYPRVPSSVRDAWPAVRPGYRMPSEVQWQGNLEPRAQSGAAMGYGGHAYSSHGFPSPGLPPGGCLAGVAADSSCALSLLSTQPWDTTTHGASHDHRSAAMSAAAASFDGNPVAVAPSVMAGNYLPPPANPWSGSRGHEGGRNVPPDPQLPHDVPLHEVHPAGSSQQGHFSGELELALQGNRPAAPGPRYGAGRSTFDHPGSSTNWSQ
ncbi:squamosa promoter-binding-like protein 14 isoform X2 [Brachypodium distachyon]|uniref:SBP-type domain-containing protein n=1 Tax=Brachypodium distachyon TaxID=15368 RepID=A0A2K2D276_BRADI|nr:squamosa promoter-binding-like protein 14 isoform X2 [Brachypodium distachyon]PNT68392.1 hypothetical protein BRADI_3g40030v3 [Brachypodium distachyon]PNT68393.1 hypothetical protein BRADI_3g40030v3 [Brachypodium distachyon]|eukprot:XP_010235296.1 squamosa promoter-binding-like protein 14 isoform X2 [Brachypodium distachyon]